MIMKNLLITFMLGLAFSLQANEKLVIKGSDTLGAKMVPQIAEAFRALHPDVVFEIAAEGSTTGITAIIDGTADIGMSSRAARPGEITAARAKGVNMDAITVSYDGLAVIVNESNPISDLNLRQIQQIFTGDVADWSTVGPFSGRISIYTRNTSSGTYQDFKNLAMRRRDYAASSQKMAGNEQIAAEVANNPTGIGYVGLAYIHTPGVKVVSINGKLPSPQTVNDKSYPLARPNFFYTNGQASGLAKEFVDYVLSSDGQKIVESVGFIPLQ